MSGKIDMSSIAALAKLSFDENEMSDMERDIAVMLELCGDLSAMDTDAIENRRVTYNALREDIASDAPYDRESLLCAAEQCKDGFITVSRASEGGE